jgi:hypothetical protein
VRPAGHRGRTVELFDLAAALGTGGLVAQLSCGHVLDANTATGQFLVERDRYVDG